MWADQALERFCGVLEIKSKVLDIGSGNGEHAAIMRNAGHYVTECDLRTKCDFMLEPYPPDYFEGVWLSHVLEHIPDCQTFLKKVSRVIMRDGLLCVTVPPMKPEIVGGHVSLWNAGLLLYRLILAGFDCSLARVGTYGYNCSVLVRASPIQKFPRLKMDHGDIALLRDYFPVGIVADGFNGDKLNIFW